MAPEDVKPPESYGISPPGFRLPAETELGRVVLRISELERSTAFYQRVLGMRMLDRGPGRAVLGSHGDDRPVVELREHRGALPAPPGGRPGLFHFAVLLPGRSHLGAFAEHLAHLGIRAGASDHAVSEAFYLQDPDGLGIEVYSDRPRAAWQSRGRELFMTTAPLDVADLRNAAGTSRWEGLPAGSRMGHVHLHVTDLEKAADFYHSRLGFDRVVWSYPGALFLSAGGYHHHLGLNTWAASIDPPAENEASLLEWEIVLPTRSDVEQAVGSIGEESSVEGAETGVVQDPWGTRLRLRARSEL